MDKLNIIKNLNYIIEGKIWNRMRRATHNVLDKNEMARSSVLSGINSKWNKVKKAVQSKSNKEPNKKHAELIKYLDKLKAEKAEKRKKEIDKIVRDAEMRRDAENNSTKRGI